MVYDEAHELREILTMNSQNRYSRLSEQQATAGETVSRFSSTTSIGKPWNATATQSRSLAAERRLTASLKGWWVELASILLAFCVMATTWVLLFYYNSKPIDETPRHPSLNTLLNIFSTAETALLLYITSEVLSQAKWRHYQRHSPLTDFNIIDNSSRGIRGSVQVLFNPRLGPMPVIGAITILLSIAIGPMLQQTVSYRTQSAPNGARNATAPIARFFAAPSNPAVSKIDPSLKRSILNGMLSQSGSGSSLSFACLSGNCTFQTPYTSLAVSHTCTSLPVTRQCDTGDTLSCNYTLSNGHFLINPRNSSVGDVAVANVSTAFNATGLMAGIFENDLFSQFAFARASIITLTNGPLCHTNGSNPECTLPQRDNATQQHLFDHGAIGAMCDIALCTNTYTANVNETIVDEKIISSTDARDTSKPQYFIASEFPDPVLVPDPCYIDGHSYPLSQLQNSHNGSWDYIALNSTDGTNNPNFTKTIDVPVSCAFSMEKVSWASTFQFVTGNPFFLDGEAEADAGMAGGEYLFNPNLGNMSAKFADQSFGVEPIFNNGNASFESIDAVFGNLATAMTNHFRQNSAPISTAGFSPRQKQIAAVPTTADGVLLEIQTIVVVELLWIILPMLVIVGTCGYLAVAIVQGGVRDYNSHGQAQLWKSNALASLVVGQQSVISDASCALSDPRAMKELKARRVVLVEGKGGWGFTEDTR